MNPTQLPLPSLIAIEREVAADAREWGRQRLAEKLQQLADEPSQVFPPPPAQAPRVDAAQRVRRNHRHR
ncbi:MAG: hypothetical protein V9H26_27370 [Verrucomicrobiota bacterium]